MNKPLTAEEINSLRLGPRFNRLVAERVVGCHVRQKERRTGPLYDFVVPGGVDRIDYTTEEGAWAAVAHLDFGKDYATLPLLLRAMERKGYRLAVEQEDDRRFWSARFDDDPSGVSGCDGLGEGRSLLEAVARAALIRVASAVEGDT